MTPTNQPSLTQATQVWARIGFLSFGGPAAQIAMMHKEVVEDRQWLSEAQFLNALNFCMLLPGPEAMQLATYAGWRSNGTLGGLIAGLLFVLPGAFVILALAALYTAFGKVPFVESLFLGVKAAVVVIVIEALIKVSRKALSGRAHYAIAAAAFVGIFFLNIPYPLIVLGAALIGWFWLPKEASSAPSAALQPMSKTVQTVLVWLVIWSLPILALWLFGGTGILTEIASFFSKLAVVTFGGAYAVLAYMAQDVVVAKEWLSTGEMMDGLGLAETTPGPLILVTEFVGFLAGYKDGGWAVGILAAVVTVWVTFAPCFLWIFTGAPYIDWLAGQPKLRGALAAITAAVVGVILNLSIWFALHVFFGKVEQNQLGPVTLWTPDFTTLNPLVLALVVLSAWLLLLRHWSVLPVLALSAGLALIIGAL